MKLAESNTALGTMLNGNVTIATPGNVIPLMVVVEYSRLTPIGLVRCSMQQTEHLRCVRMDGMIGVAGMTDRGRLTT